MRPFCLDDRTKVLVSTRKSLGLFEQKFGCIAVEELPNIECVVLNAVCVIWLALRYLAHHQVKGRAAGARRHSRHAVQQASAPIQLASTTDGL